MKAIEMLKKNPQRFPSWNLNEDADIFWSDISALEDHGFFDPWFQRINIRSAKRNYNRVGEIASYTYTTEFNGYPFELVILNE